MELLSDGGRAVELSGGVEQAARARRAKQRKTIRRFMVWLLSGLGGAPRFWPGGGGQSGLSVSGSTQSSTQKMSLLG